MAETQRAKSYAKRTPEGKLAGIEQRDRHGRVIILAAIIYIYFYLPSLISLPPSLPLSV